MAIAASALAARTRSQTEAARREARTTAELYAFSRKTAGVIELDDLLWIVVTHLARLLNAEVSILMPDKGPQESGKLALRALRSTQGAITSTAGMQVGHRQNQAFRPPRLTFA